MILEGAGTATIAGEGVALGPGDYLRVGAGTSRQVVAGPDGLRFVVIGAKPKAEYDGRSSL